MQGRLLPVVLMIAAFLAAPAATGDSLWPSAPTCEQPVAEPGYVVQLCVGGSICYAAGGQTHVFVCLDPSYCPAGAEDLAPTGACRVYDPGDLDNDGDGWTPNGGDCDDADPSVNPGAPEHVGNGVDEDCDGEVDEAH